MKSPIDKVFEKINLSSPTTFLGILLACVTTTCVLSVYMSVFAFNIRTPEMMAMYGYEIRHQTIITSAILSTFFFSIFLLLLKHIDNLRKILKDKMRHDNLTGLLTREAFLEDFNNHHVDNHNDAFLIIDADFFKKINDTHGHLAGDRALIAITKALQKGIRKTDIIGRIGGEEFAAHLKNVNYDLAVDIAERLRKNVRVANKNFDLEGVDLSVSIGAVVYKERIDLLTLMKKADQLLYKAKEKGRNRVEHNRIHNESLA